MHGSWRFRGGRATLHADEYTGKPCLGACWSAGDYRNSYPVLRPSHRHSGELSRIPFDTPEAETELAGGVLVEYSGKNLALFTLTQGVKTVVMASLMVALFIPYRLSALLSAPAILQPVLDLLFYLVLVVLVAFVAVSLIRVSMARFRINQVVSVYWIYLSLIGIAGLLLVMADHFLRVV